MILVPKSRAYPRISLLMFSVVHSTTLNIMFSMCAIQVKKPWLNYLIYGIYIFDINFMFASRR